MNQQNNKPTSRETELLECIMNIYELCIGSHHVLSKSTVLKEIEKVILPKDEHGR